MYPFVRIAKELWKFRRAEPLPLLGTHVSHHVCWPWDLDPWVELNNGRTLTLYDLGRIPCAHRLGFARVIRAQGWGITVAGVSVRYRRRVRVFDRVEMRTRCVGWDTRFIYTEQSMWRGADCTSQILVRSAITRSTGIVPMAEFLAALGVDMESPPLPGWVAAWIAAEGERPWPPSR
jgi:acyl-CoA thioesterase FadM